MYDVIIVWKRAVPQVDTKIVTRQAPEVKNGQYEFVTESNERWQIPIDNVLYITSSAHHHEEP